MCRAQRKWEELGRALLKLKRVVVDRKLNVGQWERSGWTGPVGAAQRVVLIFIRVVVEVLRTESAAWEARAPWTLLWSHGVCNEHSVSADGSTTAEYCHFLVTKQRPEEHLSSFNFYLNTL